MKTRVSNKGQVILPHVLRRKLGLRPGDLLEVSIQQGRIVLSPRRARARKAKTVVDSLTGLPVLKLSNETAPLTSKQVEEILACFPQPSRG